MDRIHQAARQALLAMLRLRVDVEDEAAARIQRHWSRRPRDDHQPATRGNFTARRFGDPALIGLRRDCVTEPQLHCRRHVVEGRVNTHVTEHRLAMSNDVPDVSDGGPPD
jgi:hypothetical protein